ncbi:MAG TPA: amidohydrolase family protein [Vicinamibacterales bacterium]|nr:amidohydrolase family protein [Vicinamibacterales bacterium]
MELRQTAPSALLGALVLGQTALPISAQPRPTPDYEFHDSHFHLTNYVQQGTDIHEFLGLMGDTVGRVALFGIPLQQTWSYENSGNFAPTYYLQTDAPLYYYSFTDAYIASVYKSLTPAEQARFEPMITGFNPADMYAADHIRRVLSTFPGVFTGIGEFSIHKEFVSSKVAGDTASLADPALDRIFDFCAETGLLVLVHNDIDMPFARQGAEPVYLEQMKSLLRRHPNTTVIWAHVGLGRVVHPVQSSASASTAERPATYLEVVTAMLEDPKLRHLNFDISWDEVAKYVVATPESLQRTATVLNRYPDRFLFGSDEVAPHDREQYLRVFRMYEPLWELLTVDTREQVTKGNFERLFGAARTKVRAWEATNVPQSR